MGRIFKIPCQLIKSWLRILETKLDSLLWNLDWKGVPKLAIAIRDTAVPIQAISLGEIRLARWQKRTTQPPYLTDCSAVRMRLKKPRVNTLQKKLGNADKRKLDEYLYAVRDVENRLVRSDKLKLGEDGIPNFPRPAGVPRDWSEHCKSMMDLLALAIQSDSTRVATFMICNEGNNRGYPDIGVPEGHHDVSHHGKSSDKQAKIQKINAYHAQHFAYFVDALAKIKEGDGSLLDNCMIVYGSGISDGDHHNHDDLPIVLVGKAGGKIKAGSHNRYPKETPLCNLYVWMLQQMGVKADSFGDSKAILKV